MPAQASGRSLLPLRCTDMESGFLGKTLLTLIYNRGGSVAEPPPLPTHKLSPHDVVAVRPVAAVRQSGAEGDKERPAQGVVYRVHDTRLVIALDDVDDAAAFDVPLRLDKLANKVRAVALRRGLAVGWGVSSTSRFAFDPVQDTNDSARACSDSAWRAGNVRAIR